MTTHRIAALQRTYEKTHAWLAELVELGGFTDPKQAYTALRAVVHSLRDRLQVDEAVHLGSQLPMLVRGFYYEGWKPALAPNKERTKEEFLDSVRESLRTNETIDPEHACRAVFELLERRITEGEVEDVKGMLPEAVRRLWEGGGERI